jgi:hypothetical protein
MVAPDDTPTDETPSKQNATVEIFEDIAEDDVSVLTTKTQDELVALLVKTRRQIHASTGSQVASGSGIPPGSGLVATSSPSNAGRQQTAPTNNAVSGANGAAFDREVRNGPSGKYSLPEPPLFPQGGGQQPSLVESAVGRFCPGKDGISNVVQLIGMQCRLIM